MDLHTLARSYLQAGGYAVRRESRGFLDMVHPEATRGRPARLLVWSDDAALAPSRELTPAGRSERDQRETALLAAFEKEMAAAPRAVGFYLVPSTVGLSADFQNTKTGAPGKLQAGGIRVPIQFFDTDYKGDTASGSKVRSAIGVVLR